MCQLDSRRPLCCGVGAQRGGIHCSHSLQAFEPAAKRPLPEAFPPARTAPPLVSSSVLPRLNGGRRGGRAASHHRGWTGVEFVASLQRNSRPSAACPAALQPLLWAALLPLASPRLVGVSRAPGAPHALLPSPFPVRCRARAPTRRPLTSSPCLPLGATSVTSGSAEQPALD